MEGVSTRRVDDLVKALGCEGISNSQVSRICGELDRVVDSFLDRPLAGGAYCYLWLDALSQKVREEGRIVNVSVAVATAVNAEGRREIIGMDVGTSEDGAFWLAFLRSLIRAGTERCGAGDLGCTPWTDRRHSDCVCRCELAEMSHALHDEPADAGAQKRISPGWPPWCAPSTSSRLPKRCTPNSRRLSIS